MLKIPSIAYAQTLFFKNEDKKHNPEIYPFI